MATLRIPTIMFSRIIEDSGYRCWIWKGMDV
jgi:hypothetical protein